MSNYFRMDDLLPGMTPLWVELPAQSPAWQTNFSGVLFTAGFYWFAGVGDLVQMPWLSCNARVPHSLKWLHAARKKAES